MTCDRCQHPASMAFVIDATLRKAAEETGAPLPATGRVCSWCLRELLPDWEDRKPYLSRSA